MKPVKQLLKRLQKASYAFQLGLIVGAYLAFYVVLCVLMYHVTWGLGDYAELTARITRMGQFLFLDSGDVPEISSVWSGINKWGLMVLTAFSSSIFTSKMISHQSNLKFSKPLVYYSPQTVRQEMSQSEGEYLVLRLLNESDDDLYNVRISATLRYFHVPTRTFQHYICTVTNLAIPVLGSQMPFRIYIEMGEVRSAIYRKTLSYAPGAADGISIQTIQSEIAAGQRPADADQLIIYLEGIDSGQGKMTTASCRYDLARIMAGRFDSIDPIAGRSDFDPKTIQARFDVVLPA
jgi:hypothetical protein